MVRTWGLRGWEGQTRDPAARARASATVGGLCSRPGRAGSGQELQPPQQGERCHPGMGGGGEGGYRQEVEEPTRKGFNPELVKVSADQE